MSLKIILFMLGVFMMLLPLTVFARVTPNDIYQQRQESYQSALAKISDPHKKQLVVKAGSDLKEANRIACARFDVDINKMAAILDEEKRRQDITKTVVAYGQGNTPLDSAAYELNYAEEAVAYQKAQDYTPNISNGNLAAAVQVSDNELKADLNMLRGKMLTAKLELNRALNYYEK